MQGVCKALSLLRRENMDSLPIELLRKITGHLHIKDVERMSAASTSMRSSVRADLPETLIIHLSQYPYEIRWIRGMKGDRRGRVYALRVVVDAVGEELNPTRVLDGLHANRVDVSAIKTIDIEVHRRCGVRMSDMKAVVHML